MKTFTSAICSILFVFIILEVIPGCNTKKSSGIAPGYDKAELLQIMPAMERTYDSADIGGFKTPSLVDIHQVFRSKVSPLKNRFDVWVTSDNKAVITIRGTIVDTAALSFTAAFYALMAPANGKIKVSDTGWFQYKLAELPGAGVHLGMLLGLYFISGELVEQVNARYRDGIRDFIIVGHSQGSSISLLATSYLWYLRKDGKLPADIRFKTYSIATPKTGNLQYAYDYEKLTAGGYALSVNNVIDWVPCIAMTFQATQDFPKVSPFRDLKGFLRGINYTPGPKFDEGFEKFSKAMPAVVTQVATTIHESVYPKIAKVMPGYVEPECMPSSDFVRSGVSVPLVPDKEYYKLFPNDPA
jgi:hypothetical protein